MIINIDKGTLLAGQPITPGWYKGTTRKVGTPEIQGTRVDIPIVLDFEDPALKVDDRTVDHTFYNATGKGIGFLVPYMAAIIRKPVKEIADALEAGQSVPFDIDKAVGVPIQFKLINEPYQGRILNKIEAFLPHDAEVTI